MSDRPEWFAPRRFGIGAGLPISWQGWLITLGLVGVVVAISIKWAKEPLVLVATLAPLVIIFLVISAWTTRGGWRWRWGEDE
jgi:hypothetical protein